MNKLVFFIVVLTLTLAAAMSTLGQAPTAITSKVVVINTAAFFDEKAGITKIIAAAKLVDGDLASKRDEIKKIAGWLDAAEKQLATMRDNVAKGIPIDERAAQVKVDEAERLRREGKYKEDEYNAYGQKRQNDVVGPVFSETMRVLRDFVKTKGYGIVLDAAKDQNGVLLFATEQFDITKEFIAFYNSRPANSP